ncbi:MAG: DNA-directed RNA polymerase subunit alpha [Paludibacteraceae bacterium]|nr:DNA-directed RNA polymerase subunit alpha [Paludibacteraceae bacterium]
MAILTFQKPEKVIMLESTDFEGKFEFRPLEPGYGITIGNALRRVLLSSLEGYAITSIKIDGVDHEFATIPNVIDDVTSIILNLKQVRLKKVVEDTEGEKVTINIAGKTVFTAGDLGSSLSQFEVLNPDLVICNMDAKAKFKMEVTINKGRGYLPAEESRNPNDEIGQIAIDAIFTPIRNVKYSVENYRVEQKTDYEKLLFEIKTDGSIHPKDALKEAANILICHFMLFSDEKMAFEISKANSDEFNEEVLHMRQLLKTRLTDLDLSVRALNCLKSAEVETLGQLCQFSRNDLLKFRNFGKKSLTELDAKLLSLNLQFGMDISKYKIDKE